MIKRFLSAIAELSDNGKHSPLPFLVTRGSATKQTGLDGESIEPFPPLPREVSKKRRAKRGMIGNSSQQYAFIRACILLLQSIGPLSVLWTTGRLLGYFPRVLVLDAIAVVETCFYLLVYLPIKAFYQGPAQHPPIDSSQERDALIRRVLDTIPDLDKFLSEWFYGANIDDIKEDNVKEYLAWAFFNCHLEQVTDSEDQKDLDSYVRLLETHPSRKGRKFAPGRGKVAGMRLTLDPVLMKHRPFGWYMILLLVDTLTFFLLRAQGFAFCHPRSIQKVFPPRLNALHSSTKLSPSPILSYYVKPHTSKTRLPIVILHGIGVGLNTYVPLIKALNNHAPPDDQVGVIAIEILQVSFRLTPKISDSRVLAAEIHRILRAEGFERVVLVSHSYGSIVTSHLLKFPAARQYIASAVLIDPVSILVHHASVAYNFIYRPPKSAAEWQLHYFAGTDPGVARTLSRSFFWAENVLWKEELQGIATSVVLGGRDLIVDTKSVAKYISDGAFGGTRDDLVVWDSKGSEVETGGASARTGKSDVEDVRVLWFDRCDHANVVERGRYRREVVREILWRCETAGGN